MLQELITNINTYLTLILAYGFSVTIAGAAKAWIAKKMGDYTGEYAGFLTLDPLVHVDLMGMIFLLLTGWGWGRNVPVDTENIQAPQRNAKLLMLFYSPLFFHILLSVCAIFTAELLDGFVGRDFFTVSIFGKILISILKAMVQVNLFLAMLRFIQASMDLVFMHAVEQDPEYSMYIQLGSLLIAILVMHFLGLRIVMLFGKFAYELSQMAHFVVAFLFSTIYKLFAWM